MKNIKSAIIFIALMIFLPIEITFACGMQHQRPCNIWERVPSCDSGLIEQSGKCIKPKSNVTPALNCGKINQRPCKVHERTPSCDNGLVEDFSKNRCLKPNVRPALNCGKLQQRPCSINERVPSCNKGLMEDFITNKCTQPSNELKQTFNALERIPTLGANETAKLVNRAIEISKQISPVVNEAVKSIKQLERQGVTPKRIYRLLNKNKYNKLADLLNARSLAEKFNRMRFPHVDDALFTLQSMPATNPAFFQRASSDMYINNAEDFAENLRLVRHGGGFHAMTIGWAVDISMLINGTVETGISINLKPASSTDTKVYGYESASIGGGITAGFDGSIFFGFWLDGSYTIDGYSYAVNLAGSYQGGAAVAIVFTNPFVDTNGKPVRGGRLKFSGFAVAPQVGVSGEVEVVSVRTKIVGKN